MNKQSNYFRGLPTKIDVDKLYAAFGTPKEGDIIRMDDAAEKIGLDIKSNRFRTIMSCWRRNLFREHKLLSIGTGDGAIRIADPADRIDYATRKVKMGRRAIGVAVAVAYGTDTKRLTADLSKTRTDILDMNNSRLRLAVGVMK